jgi:hypothetical protein
MITDLLLKIIGNLGAYGGITLAVLNWLMDLPRLINVFTLVMLFIGIVSTVIIIRKNLAQTKKTKMEINKIKNRENDKDT